MNNLKLFFLNGDTLSKNLIYEHLSSHEVPAGGGAYEKKQKDVSSKASEALDSGKIKVPLKAESAETPTVKTDKLKDKRLEAYVNENFTLLIYSEKKDFIKTLKAVKPVLDVENSTDKKFIDDSFNTFLDSIEAKDRERYLKEYLRKNFTLLNYTEQNNLISALRKLKPKLDVAKKTDTDFIEQCFSEYIVAKEPITFVAAVENVIQKEGAIASLEKRSSLH